jgi:hypothetical protein
MAQQGRLDAVGATRGRAAREWCRIAFVLAVCALWRPLSAVADDNWWRNGWALTGFAGVLSVQESSQIWLHGDFKLANDVLVGIAASKQLWRYKDYFDLEFETQVVKHFGGEDNFEFNLPLMLRWNRFPWDDVVDTSIAFGDGPSIANGTPALEKAQYGGDHSGPLLNFVVIEFTFALPDHPEIQFVNRLQHRSGAFNLINNTSDASTAFVWGFKYRF